MFDLNLIRTKAGRRALLSAPHALQQQRLMIAALTLLLVALGIVLYRDRDFWFPDTEQVDNQPLQSGPVVATALSSPGSPPTTPRAKARPRGEQHTAPAQTSETPDPPTTITRTILPPLEVEVIAGSVHKTVRPGSSAVHVDLQAAQTSEAVPNGTPITADTAASVTVSAAERTQLSDDTASLVTQAVSPDYPLLARQMKVQGSVILQALIGRDGLIQNLRVLSGPPILATAAREAVKQWHFKPHYEGASAVETQAKITVNFTISTN